MSCPSDYKYPMRIPDGNFEWITKQLEKKKRGYFSESKISTVRNHQESVSGQMMSSAEESFTCKWLKR